MRREILKKTPTQTINTFYLHNKDPRHHNFNLLQYYDSLKINILDKKIFKHQKANILLLVSFHLFHSSRNHHTNFFM